MKKFLLIILCISMCALSVACGNDKNTAEIGQYQKEGTLPSFASPLYSGSESEQYAILFREYNTVQSTVAIGSLGGEHETLYTAPENCCIYELCADDGIIAFYELSAQSTEDIFYELKIIDTETKKTYSPYSKLIDEDEEVQPRFIGIYNKTVYYLTISLKLSQCRIMKYDLSTDTLEQYRAFNFTDNEFTYGHSCTFLNIRDNYLISCLVDEYDQYITVYDLSENKRIKKKKLPSNVAVLYFADYDPSTEMYALYYGKLVNNKLSTDSVGIIADESSTIKEIYDTGSYTTLNHESLKIVNNLLIYDIQDSSAEDTYHSLMGILYDLSNDSLVQIPGSMQTWEKNNSIFNLCLDEQLTTKKIIVFKREILTK